MILRDHLGAIIFSSFHRILHCCDALEAELLSLKEGISLSLQWSQLAIVTETDCLEAVNLLNKEKTVRSLYGFIVHEIKLLMEQGNTHITHIRCNHNPIGYLLANCGSTSGRIGVRMAWFRSIVYCQTMYR